jgi:hypothetical protein
LTSAASGVRWIDTPQLPHGWEAGLLFEETTATLFAGDCAAALGDLAGGYERLFEETLS